jgi:hypothetical protein
MERIMYYKNAIQKLARNIDLVSHPAAIAVISGIFSRMGMYGMPSTAPYSGSPCRVRRSFSVRWQMACQTHRLD